MRIGRSPCGRGGLKSAKALALIQRRQASASATKKAAAHKRPGPRFPDEDPVRFSGRVIFFAALAGR
jgi:hypothetical protein